MSDLHPPIPPSARDQALDTLTSAGRKLARPKRPDPIKQELMLMLVAIVTHLPMTDSDLKQAENWCNCIMSQDPLPRDEMVVWSVDQLKDAVTTSPTIVSSIKNRTHRLIDGFQNANLVPGLVQVYVDLSNLMDFEQAYNRLTKNAGAQLKASFKRQLDEILSQQPIDPKTKRPKSYVVVEVLKDLAGILLGQDSAVELLTQVKNGMLDDMPKLAQRYRNRETLLMNSDALLRAVVALKDEEDRVARKQREDAAAALKPPARGTHKTSEATTGAADNSL